MIWVVADFYGPLVSRETLAWVLGIGLGVPFLISVCVLTWVALYYRRSKGEEGALQLKWALRILGIPAGFLLAGGVILWATGSPPATAVLLFLLAGLSASVYAIRREGMGPQARLKRPTEAESDEVSPEDRDGLPNDSPSSSESPPRPDPS